MKKLISMLLCAQLALCLMPAPVLAKEAADEYVFTFRNGITWDSTLEEAMAAEGIPEGDAYTDGDISMFHVDGASFAGLSVDFYYLSMNGMLICISCTPDRDTDNAEALADIKAALTEMYGQPNMTELSRVLNIAKIIGGDEGIASIEASPWAGWVLPDERTLVFASDIDGSVGLIFFNEAPFAPAPASEEAPQPADRVTTRGFDTAEECAKAVAEALIAGDVQAFLDCYAIPEMARSFDHAAYIEAYRMTQLGRTLAQPSDDLAIAYNESYFVNDLLKRMISSNLVLKSNDENVQKYAGGSPIVVTEEQTPNELLEIANPGNALSRLSYQGTMTPDITNSDLMNRWKKQMAWHRAVYGIADITELVVELELDSRTVYFPLTLVQYNGGWLAAPIVSAIGYLLYGMPVYMLMIPADMLEK